MSDLYANWAWAYDYYFPDRAGEVNFWAGQAEPYGRRVLDLMCGTAEVSLELARRGYRVLGTDLFADLALVDVSSIPGLPAPVSLGDGEELPIGSTVYMIGYPAEPAPAMPPPRSFPRPRVHPSRRRALPSPDPA